LDCKATDRDGATFDPRFGGAGKQTIRDRPADQRSAWEWSTSMLPTALSTTSNGRL